MSWSLKYLPEAIEDIRSLDKSIRILVRKAINKAKQNPLPQNEGGYGKPLGSKNGMNLTGCYKLKLLGSGLRIVYKLERIDKIMVIVIVGVREDNDVYKEAKKRINSPL